MRKYIIDYGFERATFYTPAKDVKKRFEVLAGTCFGIRKSIMYVRICETLLDDREDQRFECLKFSGDCYIWRDDGARQMVEPWPDDKWDTDYCAECKLEE